WPTKVALDPAVVVVEEVERVCHGPPRSGEQRLGGGPAEPHRDERIHDVRQPHWATELASHLAVIEDRLPANPEPAQQERGGNPGAVLAAKTVEHAWRAFRFDQPPEQRPENPARAFKHRAVVLQHPPLARRSFLQ